MYLLFYQAPASHEAAVQKLQGACGMPQSTSEEPFNWGALNETNELNAPNDQAGYTQKEVDDHLNVSRRAMRNSLLRGQ